MRNQTITAAACLGVAAVSASAPAQALTWLHKTGVEGGRLCMTDHTHFGSSGTVATKKQAIAAANQSWAGFTAAEYGYAWGQIRAAAGRQYECLPNRAGPTTRWSCTVRARPCKVGGATAKAKAKGGAVKR